VLYAVEYAAHVQNVMEKEKEMIEFYLFGSKLFIFLTVSCFGRLSTTLYGRDKNMGAI
jgi:hypothetical protein